MRNRQQEGPATPPAKAPGYTCSICGTQVAALPIGAPSTEGAHRYRPFCSSRCQRIDLGNWLDERYVVPGPPAAVEEETESS